MFFRAVVSVFHHALVFSVPSLRKPVRQVSGTSFAAQRCSINLALDSEMEQQIGTSHSRRTDMKAITRPALVLGMTGAIALGSMTASEARVRPWAAGAVGFAAGAMVGAAAANASYYGPGYYDAGYAYEPASYGYAEPAYYGFAAPAHTVGYAYDSYAYEPDGYVAAPAVTYSYQQPAYAHRTATYVSHDAVPQRRYVTRKYSSKAYVPARRAYSRNAGYSSYDPTFANTSDPNSIPGPRYGHVAYDSYAYAPAPAYGAYAAGYNEEIVSTRSVPRHYDPGYGYNSNTLAPWSERKLQAVDY